MKYQITEWLEGITLADAEIRKEIMIFPFGEFQHPVYGKLKFDEKFFNEIIDNFNKKVLMTDPFIDQQHNEDKALAWMKKSPYIRPGKGLFIQPEWTDLGKTQLQAKIYKYFSPSWGPYKNPETGETYKNVLKGGAATNIPFLKMMPAMIDENVRMSLSMDSTKAVEVKISDLIIGSSSGKADKAEEPYGQTRPKINTNLGGIMKDKLVKTLNLSADATEEVILQKINDVIQKFDSIEKELNELKSKSSPDTAVLSAKLSETQKQLLDVNKKLIEKDCETILNKALTEGRMLPADREYWKNRYLSDPENVGKDLEKLPKVIDFTESGSSGDGKETKNLSEDPGELLVAKAKALVLEKKAENFDKAVEMVCASDKKLMDAYIEKYDLSKE